MCGQKVDRRNGPPSGVAAVTLRLRRFDLLLIRDFSRSARATYSGGYARPIFPSVMWRISMAARYVEKDEFPTTDSKGRVGIRLDLQLDSGCLRPQDRYAGTVAIPFS